MYILPSASRTSARHSAAAMRHSAALRRILKHDRGLDKLGELIGHSSSEVRLWVATVLLLHGRQEAVAELERLAKELGEVGLNAEITLDQCKKGQLKPFW